MRNIMLFCAGGMSTSILVKKMEAAAAAQGYDVTISAHALAQVDELGPQADILLLGPQVRFQMAGVKAKFPDKPVEAINPRDYGIMNGEAVIAEVKKVLGD